MELIVIFVLGVGNFALHRAVMDSNHAALGYVSWFADRTGRRFALGLEFGVLLSAMLLAANGWPTLAWGYLIYSLLNGVSGYLILTGRI